MEQHSTTMNFSPSEPLLNQWIEEIHNPGCNQVGTDRPLVDKAAQWGADEQLDEVCVWLKFYSDVSLSALLDAMRPKPKSLAKKATYELDQAVLRGDSIATTEAMPVLREALKRLKELETTQELETQQ